MAWLVRFSLCLAAFATCMSMGIAGLAIAQVPTTSPATPFALAKALPSKAVKPSKATKPMWGELKPEQHIALAPLQTEWLKMSEAQKRKWLELSKNYGKLNADDQTKLHARMTEWVQLSPEQRAHARLNFSVAKTLSTEEKQKQWDAYQALSAEEKIKLQAKAKASTPNSAALAVKPQNKVLPSKPSATPLPVRPAATLSSTEK